MKWDEDGIKWDKWKGMAMHEVELRWNYKNLRQWQPTRWK